jgi:hypothetical protein
MGVRKIGQYAFQFCKEIRTITIQNPECAIDEYAFYESGLEELTAPWKKCCGLNGCAKLRTVKITTIMGDRWTFVNSWGEEYTQGPATFKLSPKSEMLDKIYAPQCDISRLGNAKIEAVLGYVELVDNNYPVEEQFDSAYENYIRKQKKKLYPIAIQDMHLLNYMMRKKIIPLVDIAVCMELAEKQSEAAVTAELLEYQHTSFNAKDHTKHEEQQISKVLHVPTQTENLKKDFSTKKDEDGTLIVTVYKGDSKDIAIPEQIGKGKVATIGPEAFSPQNVRITPEQRAVRRNIQSVTIGKHITMIGYSAFEGCENLAQVYIENESVEIGARAFRWCPKLVDEEGFLIVNGDLIQYLGNEERVVVPENVTEIQGSVFKDHSEIKEIILPEKLCRLGDHAFVGCNITEITIPQNVKSVSDNSFVGCKKLKKVHILSPYTPVASSIRGRIPKVTYCAPAGSYAETYAKAFNVPFVAE